MNVDQTIQEALKHGFSSVKFVYCVINLCLYKYETRQLSFQATTYECRVYR